MYMQKCLLKMYVETFKKLKNCDFDIFASLCVYRSNIPFYFFFAIFRVNILSKSEIRSEPKPYLNKNI